MLRKLAKYIILPPRPLKTTTYRIRTVIDHVRVLFRHLALTQPWRNPNTDASTSENYAGPAKNQRAQRSKILIQIRRWVAEFQSYLFLKSSLKKA